MKFMKGLTLAAALGATSIACASCTKSKMVSACEEEIIDRLTAPTTYKLIEANETSVQITFPEYFKGRRDSTQMQELLTKAASGPPLRMIAVITYEAANVFGTPLRKTSVCSYDSLKGDGPASKYFVAVDGKTSTDLLTEQAIRLAPNQPASKR